jgi:cyclase
MLAKRIIPCLDVNEGRVVKGVKFKQLKDSGDPVELARQYYQQGADELTFLDIGASYQSREIIIDVVEKVGHEIFIPLTVGGGLRSITDMRNVLRAGADKIALCTAALNQPLLIQQGARAFGSQCVVLSIDAKKQGDTWYAYSHGGRFNTQQDVLTWAKKGEALGAGEILLNSIDQDGTHQGYDLELTAKVASCVSIPVIASGGAGDLDQMVNAIKKGKADAILLASLLHAGKYSIADIKKYLHKHKVAVRC